MIITYATFEHARRITGSGCLVIFAILFYNGVHRRPIVLKYGSLVVWIVSLLCFGNECRSLFGIFPPMVRGLINHCDTFNHRAVFATAMPYRDFEVLFLVTFRILIS
jgi:hypothetical protein